MSWRRTLSAELLYWIFSQAFSRKTCLIPILGNGSMMPRKGSKNFRHLPGKKLDLSAKKPVLAATRRVIQGQVTKIHHSLLSHLSLLHINTSHHFTYLETHHIYPTIHQHPLPVSFYPTNPTTTFVPPSKHSLDPSKQPPAIRNMSQNFSTIDLQPQPEKPMGAHLSDASSQHIVSEQPVCERSLCLTNLRVTS